MRFSIVHASARPLGWQAAYAQYQRLAAKPDEMEYLLVFDEAQQAEFRQVLLPPEESRIKHIINTGERSYVAAANFGAKFAKGEILLMATDDMFPMSPNWDRYLWESDWPSGGHTWWIDDGVFPHIMTMQIFTRSWYERYGYVFQPKYSSMGGDCDFSLRAKRDGVVIDARDDKRLRWRHHHYRNGGRRRDTIDDVNQSAQRYLQSWRNLREDWPDYMSIEPIDSLYENRCAMPSDINEHLPKLKEMAALKCSYCWGRGQAYVAHVADDGEDTCAKATMEGRCGNIQCPKCKGSGKRGAVILELGVRTGNSTAAFLAGRPEYLLSMDLDTSQIDPQIPAAAIYSGIHFDLVQRDSREPFPTDVGWDIVFIDTLHTEAQIAAELAAHAPQCRRYIIIHDTVTNDKIGEDGGPGITGPIIKLVETGEWMIHEHFTNNNGLTILRRK